MLYRAGEAYQPHLEFQHPPTGPNQSQEQFILPIAGGNYPNVIEWNWINPSNTPGDPAKAMKSVPAPAGATRGLARQ